MAESGTDAGMHAGRRREHARNPRLEALLQELNGLLECSESRAIESFAQPAHPVVFIMGCARSGTTLALQTLAASGQFAYPSNLVARFYGAPYIGARIQQMLTDANFDHAGELGTTDSEHPPAFASRLGKTRGLTAPSEFWYFWRRFFPARDIQYYTDDELQQTSRHEFLAEIAALESVSGRPVAMKGLYLNWNIEFLSQLFNRAVFIHVRRDPLLNMQSLLYARRDYFGDDARWYSFKPPEYSWLATRSLETQLAGQVFYTNRAISQGLAQLPPRRCLTVDYETLCAQPASLIEALADKLFEQGYTLDLSASAAIAGVHASHKLTLPAELLRSLEAAYGDISAEVEQPV